MLWSQTQHSLIWISVVSILFRIRSCFSDLTVNDWKDNSIGERGIAIMCETLLKNTSLSVLNISRMLKNEGWAITSLIITKLWFTKTVNDLGYPGAKIVSEMLKTNTTLTELEMGCFVKWIAMQQNLDYSRTCIYRLINQGTISGMEEHHRLGKHWKQTHHCLHLLSGVRILFLKHFHFFDTGFEMVLDTH